MAFPVVGMVGAGQLARMTAQAAIGLGVRLRVLAATPDESAAQVLSDVVVGDHRDPETLRDFARGCDVVTFDHEHVPPAAVAALESSGVAVAPGSAALIHAQDKATMRFRLGGIGVAVPRWRAVTTEADVVEFAEATRWPVMIKAVRGGYDGRGVWAVDDAAAARSVLAEARRRDRQVLVEEAVPFERELAALVARSPGGQAVAYPVVETVQVDGICREVRAPAPIDEERAVAAQHVALRIAQQLGVTGLLAVELFDTGAGIVVNELAMRPHNCGHWTLDAAHTSQFEQHLRAILDLPLGDPGLLTPAAAMVNVLGGDAPDLYARYPHVLARDPGVRLHVYGKEVKPGRKIGHVTAAGRDPRRLLERARSAAGYLGGDDDA